jgi:hypothetical protein
LAETDDRGSQKAKEETEPQRDERRVIKKQARPREGKIKRSVKCFSYD